MCVCVCVYVSIQVELALGAFPYGKWTTIFEQLNAVVNGPAPELPEKERHSAELREFAAAWCVGVGVCLLYHLAL